MDHHLLDIDMEAIEDEESYEGPDGYVDENDAEDYGLEVEDAAEEQSIEGAATIGQLLDGGITSHIPISPYLTSITSVHYSSS